ncbi:antitoxin Xre/MbcA/ParS toxin-binding domain-containing protein [Rhizobium rhododendri]|uniref:antitoxin Xre/MbcA/ParS toxin-binding domain-containing protein n=1 Tax=Rhizobium rhododendri TaxID=2506430 RepID=UPI00244674FE|nr:antitoxin Xre/MbcA/ParS toxin-binding domain-containing protein [Rhizobium rhododendri]
MAAAKATIEDLAICAYDDWQMARSIPMADSFPIAGGRSTQAALVMVTDNAWPSFEAKAVGQLREHGFSTEEIYRFVAPRRTLARRVEKGEPLTLAENDSAQRLLRISELADKVFGDHDKAHQWLRNPNRALKGIAPIDLLESETGARLVETSLYQIDYGIYV